MRSNSRLTLRANASSGKETSNDVDCIRTYRLTRHKISCASPLCMDRSIDVRWQTLKPQSAGLLAVSCIAWLGAGGGQLEDACNDFVGKAFGVRVHENDFVVFWHSDLGWVDVLGNSEHLNAQ